MSLSFTEETGSCFFIPIVTIVHVTMRSNLASVHCQSTLLTQFLILLNQPHCPSYVCTHQQACFFKYSNVNSSSSLASLLEFHLNLPYYSFILIWQTTQQQRCYLLIAYFFTDATQLFNESQYSTNVLLHVLVVLKSHLVQFLSQIHFATEIRSFVYLLKLFPHVLRTCAVADVNKLVVFNSQRYRTLSFFVFSLPIVRDRIRCVALHYLICVLANQ